MSSDQFLHVLQQIIKHSNSLAHYAHLAHEHLANQKEAGALLAMAVLGEHGETTEEEIKSLAETQTSHCRACKSEIAIIAGNAKVFNPDGSDHAATCQMKRVVCKASSL